MLKLQQLRSFKLHFVLFCASQLIAGCHGTLGRSERLDRSTGMTLSSASEPIVFARTESRYSRSARDYVYLGPVETNRQGTRSYYLWVGIATTLDRGYLAPVQDVPATLFLEVQGEIMELKLRPWPDRVPGLDRTPPYRTAVEIQTALAAPVTLNQLDLIARELLPSIRVGDAEGSTQTYVRWGQQQNWAGFFDAPVSSEPLQAGQASRP